MGVVVAFAAGFFLGHFTGHHHTTTVVAGATTTSTEESTTSEESNEGETVTASNGIVMAPKFTSEELFEHAGDDWISNGGGTTNDRFSSLDEVNTENVSELKGDWMTKIGANATAAKFSAEGPGRSSTRGRSTSPTAPTTSSRSTPATAIASGPTNRTFRPTRSAKSSAAVGTTAASRSATAWCSSPS